MSNINLTKRKLALLRKSPAKELLYDAIKRYTTEVEGMSPSMFLIEEVNQIVDEIEKVYLSQIPKKQVRSHQIDLEDSIKECNNESKTNRK